MDVSALVGDIPTQTVTVRFFAAPTINAFGEAVSTSSTLDITAVVHPTGRRERENLPAIDRAREMISVYVLTAVDTVRAVRPAEVLYQGRTYEVIRCGDYAALGNIYLLTAALLDEVAPPPP